MIHSVTIALDGSVYSIKRGGGRSSVTAITSKGSRIVAGAHSVLVDDGVGFVVWPEVTAGSPAKTAKAKTTKPTTKTAKAKKQ